MIISKIYGKLSNYDENLFIVELGVGLFAGLVCGLIVGLIGTVEVIGGLHIRLIFGLFAGIFMGFSWDLLEWILLEKVMGEFWVDFLLDLFMNL